MGNIEMDLIKIKLIGTQQSGSSTDIGLEMSLAGTSIYSLKKTNDPLVFYFNELYFFQFLEKLDPETPSLFEQVGRLQPIVAICKNKCLPGDLPLIFHNSSVRLHLLPCLLLP